MEDNRGDIHQFELLSLIHGNRNATKRLIHIQFIIIIIMLFGMIYLASRPPLVVRIDKLGNTDVVKDYHAESAQPTDEDIQNFSKKFLDDYIGLKSNLVVRQLETSLNMMSTDLAKQHLKAMKEQNTVGIVQAAGVRNDIKFQDMRIERIGDEVYVKVNAILETRPLNDLATPPKSKPIVASLVLDTVPRSGNHPFAVLTKGVQILMNKNGTQAEENLGEVIHGTTE